MEHRVRKILTSLIAILAATNLEAQQSTPKLVVCITVDQLRGDYIEYFYNTFGERGFKRLMNEGFNCENTMINYIPAITAVGHTSVYTGSVPSVHGIVGNHFYVDGKYGYCTADTTMRTVGSNTKAGQMSPRNMLATPTTFDLKSVATF